MCVPIAGLLAESSSGGPPPHPCVDLTDQTWSKTRSTIIDQQLTKREAGEGRNKGWDCAKKEHKRGLLFLVEDSLTQMLYKMLLFRDDDANFGSGE